MTKDNHTFKFEFHASMLNIGLVRYNNIQYMALGHLITHILGLLRLGGPLSSSGPLFSPGLRGTAPSAPPPPLVGPGCVM